MEDIPHVKPGAHTWSVTAGGSRGWHWKHSALAYFNNYNLSESDLSAGRCRRFVYVMDQRDESLLYAAILPCSSINSASYIRFLVAGDKSPNQNYLSFFINNSFFAPVQAYPVKEFPEEQGGGFYMKSKSNDVLKYCTINNLQPHGLAIPVLHELTAYRATCGAGRCHIGLRRRRVHRRPGRREHRMVSELSGKDASRWSRFRRVGLNACAYFRHEQINPEY